MGFLRNQKGVSLLEMLVAVGILGIVTYFVVETLKNGTLGQKTLQAQDDSRVLTDSMASLLTDPVACLNTFIATNSPNSPFNYNVTSPLNVPQLVDGNRNPQFAVPPTGTPLNVYGNRSLQLVNVQIGGDPSKTDIRTAIPYWSQSPSSGLPLSGTAFVQVTWKQSGKNATDKSGPSTLFRYFLVGFTFNTLGQPISCTAITGGGGNNVNYWSMAPSGAIFNNNQNQLGNVGIGTPTPTAALDVAGAIRPGTTSVCDSSTEGAIRYNLPTHELQYCTQLGTWAAVGGGMSWALLNLGSQTVVKGKGIASVVSSGGTTTVTFSAPMPDLNYTVVITPGSVGGLSNGQWLAEISASRTLQSFTFNTMNWGGAWPVGGTPSFANVMVMP
ncbi:MAG: type II secretion system protein [Bdellovibrionota bacterium]